MGQIKFIGALLMTVLFAIAIISYSFNFANDNTVYADLRTDSDFVALNNTLKSNVKSFNSETNGSVKAFFESTVASGDETTTTGGAFKGNILSIGSTAKTIFEQGRYTIFGNESQGFGVILAGLLSFLTFVGILYIWKTWKGGSPD